MILNSKLFLKSFVTKLVDKRCIFDLSYKVKSAPKIIDHDPPYIKNDRKIPVYDALQIQCDSYDYVLLESYSSYIHKLLMTKNIKFSNYAVPNTAQTISLYIPRSTKVSEQIKINKYCRIFNVFDIETTKLSLMVEMFMQMQPEGVDFQIGKPSEELEKFRYVPELEKNILKQQLDILEKTKDLNK